MNSSTLRITPIVQERFDAFLKEVFDIWQSSEDPTAKIPWSTVAADAICDTVEAYVADYRRFMSPEESYTKYPKSARIFIGGISKFVSNLVYQTDSHLIGFCNTRSELFREEPSAVHHLVQELQGLFKEPLVTVTIDYHLDGDRALLGSLSDQNIRTIVAHFKHGGRKVEDLLAVIGERSANIPDGTTIKNPTDWPFKSLSSIEIHDAYLNYDDFPRLVEGYLHKNSKPLLEEIVLVGCSLRGQELAQATQRIAAIGITIRGVGCTEY